MGRHSTGGLKATESHLVINLKNNLTRVNADYTKKVEEVEALKRNI